MVFHIIKKSWYQITQGGALIYLLLGVCILIFGIIAPAMVSRKHLLELAVIASSLGIVAIGQTLVMLTGMFDLSVGAMMTLTNVLGSGMIGETGDNLVIVLVFLISLGALIGYINGYGITRFKIPPFMMTLAVLLVLRGVVLVYTKGAPKGTWPSSIQFIGKGWLAGVFPVSTLIWLLLTVAGIYWLKKTMWGRYIYATGGNPQTAFLSGIRTSSVIILVYILSGVLSAIGGIILSGYVGWGSFQVGGEDYLLKSLAAAVLGGTTFSGGSGGLGGTLAGAYLLTLIDSGLTMAGVGYAGRLIFTGSVIIVFTGLYEKLSTKAA